MIYKLITLPAWGLSLLVLPIIISIALNIDLTYISLYAQLLIIVGGIWAFSIGSILNKKIPNEKKLNFNIFKTAVFYLVVYASLTPYIMNITTELMPFMIIPGHIFFFSSLILVLYFISKCLVITRHKKESIGLYMLGLYFFPVGIWFIQPRILNVLKEKSI